MHYIATLHGLLVAAGTGMGGEAWAASCTTNAYTGYYRELLRALCSWRPCAPDASLSCSSSLVIGTADSRAALHDGPAAIHVVAHAHPARRGYLQTLLLE
jgi:hypothetical protein